MLILLGRTEDFFVLDPFLVELPEGKSVSSASVSKYITEELIYYYQFYNRYKHCGNPFSVGWTEWPPWVTQLICMFDNTIEMTKRFIAEKDYDYG